MILLPTPGHTPGSLPMLLRSKGWAPILLAGDLTYEAALMERGVMPGTGGAAVLRVSYEKVRRLRERLPDPVVVPSHDFAATESARRATRGSVPGGAAGWRGGVKTALAGASVYRERAS